MTLRRMIIRSLPEPAREQGTVRRHFVTKLSQMLEISPDTAESDVPPAARIRLTKIVTTEVFPLYYRQKTE